MSAKPSLKSDSEVKYLRFVKQRLATTNYHAAEKLKRIDELAEIIFRARKSYHRQVGS